MNGIGTIVDESVYQHPTIVPGSIHDGSSVRNEEEYDDGEDDEYHHLQPARARVDNHMVGARDCLPGSRFLGGVLSKSRVKTGSGLMGRRTQVMFDSGFEPARMEDFVTKEPTLPYPSLAPTRWSSTNNSTVTSPPSLMRSLPITNTHIHNAQHASMPPPTRKQSQIPKKPETSDAQFNVQLDKLAQLLPHADRNVLAGYLRRAGHAMLAIGRYVEDERNGTIVYH